MVTFHPDLKGARFLPSIPFGPRSIRLMNSGSPRPKPTPDDLVIDDVEVPGIGSNPPARLRLYRPARVSSATPALLWIHGGGFVIGSPLQDEARSIETVRRLGITVAALTYRLAPDNPAPAALDDAFAALTWLHEHADARLIDPERIAIGGASAGGGLAATLVLRAHDAGIGIPFQLLVYPMLDDRTVLRTDVDSRALRMWTTKNNRFGWSSYLGREPGGADVTPYEAAARRLDVTALPPAWIGVGSHDLFHDEDVEYARRLTEAGVPCELVIVPGAFHGFDAVYAKAPVVRTFFEQQLAALSSGLAL